jgi:membrane-bound lytic murein transglycosylase D
MDELFPAYESIKPNIEFWKKVYSEYTTSQVIIHDKRNLSLIYEIINIKGKDEPDAHKYNKNIVNKKKEHYSDMVKRLASGHKPLSEEEKRIHGLFSENGLKHLLKEANDNIRAQLGQKDRFIAGLLRSGAYIDEIREILKYHGLPEDLAYLPHVESSFDYQAYSKFGAAGIWQFTNSTGKRYLKIDYTVDERRDPILATHAAARFLKENYNILGSWPVALTAYNHGSQGMQRALKAHGSYEKIYKSYDSRSFGFASRNFYSEFLAAREVASNYRKYFGELKLDDPVKRVMVNIPGNSQ